MSSHLVVALLTGLSSLLVGLLVGRGLFKRRQADKCRELAQDLTDKVHDRCDAYRRLEERISGVIGDFDRQETEIRDEPMIQTSGRHAQPAPAASTPTAAAACGDGLAWMDACAVGCQPAAVPVEGNRIPQPTTAPRSPASSVESEIDVFAQRLRGAQDSNRAMLDEQSRVLMDLQRRIASIESSPRPAPEAFPAAPGAGRRVASPVPELTALSESLARSERELHEWRARCEDVVQEREASIANAREVLAQLRSVGPAIAPEANSDCEGCGRARDLARQILDIRPEAAAERERLRQPSRAVPSAPAAAAADLREVEELQQRLAAKQREVDAMRSDLSKAGQLIDGNRTRITHLMRSLEQTHAKAEERRRQVQEQTSQVTEAYSMLDRMRPLLKAIEGAAADDQFSALTPEYLEARSRG